MPIAREEWEQLGSKGKADTEQILQIFVENPSEAYTAKDISEITGLETQSTQYHLRKLVKDHNLDSRRKGRVNYYALKEDLTKDPEES